jgi:hypothetical protein
MLGFRLRQGGRSKTSCFEHRGNDSTNDGRDDSIAAADIMLAVNDEDLMMTRVHVTWLRLRTLLIGQQIRWM